MLKKLQYAILVLSCVCNVWAVKANVEKAFPNIYFYSPLFITHAGDGSNRLFIVEQRGTIQVIVNDPNTSEKTEFLNITDRVNMGASEMGLLGLAFHPDYKENRFLYVNYTYVRYNQTKTRISRFRTSISDSNHVNADSELVLMEFNQPYQNHNGGMLAFGPDGYLYIGVGDGGSGGDPENNAQNLKRLLGKILRIDVDNPVSGSGQYYAIPPDNPLAGNELGYDEKIWTWGMRNPWRFSFDPETGLLYCGDVGQGEYEEVDIIEGGRNYGWKLMEGNHWYHYQDTTGLNLAMPIKEYPHSQGNSITGGYVYHGQNQPELRGAYIYGDFSRGKIWMLRYENGVVVQDELVRSPGINISSFGVDENQELYFCDYGYGWIYRFENVNHVPQPGTLVSPLSGDTLSVLEQQVSFTWHAFSDEDGDTLNYHLHLFNSEIETTIPVGNDTTCSFWASSVLQYDTQYGWAISATDHYANVAYSDTSILTITKKINSAPVASTLVFPANDDTLSFDAETIQFIWSVAQDPDGDSLAYVIHINSATKDTLFSVGGETTFAWFDHDASGQSVVYEWFVVVSDGEFTTESDHVFFVVMPPASTNRERSAFPGTLALYPNYPNPFNPETTLRFFLPNKGLVRLVIYDLQGHLVKELIHQEKQAGFWSHTWDGKNSTGEQASSGIYIAQLIFQGYRQSQRLLLLK